MRKALTRRNAVLASLIAAGVALLAATRTWITVPPPANGVALAPLAVSGTDASSAVLALTIVAVVCAVATTLVGRIAGLIVGALQLLVGVAIVALVFPVLSDPVAAAAASVGKKFGTESVAGEYVVSVWPWLAVLGGVLVALSSLGVLIGGRGWRTGRRYERTSSGNAVVTQETMDDVDRWDALTRGDDPTDGDDGIAGARFH